MRGFLTRVSYLKLTSKLRNVAIMMGLFKSHNDNHHFLYMFTYHVHKHKANTMKCRLYQLDVGCVSERMCVSVFE